MLLGDYLLIGNQRFILTVDLNGRHANLGTPYNDSAANVVGVDFDYRWVTVGEKMWQSSEEIEDYSTTYFDCIVVFEVLYHWISGQDSYALR